MKRILIPSVLFRTSWNLTVRHLWLLCVPGHWLLWILPMKAGLFLIALAVVLSACSSTPSAPPSVAELQGEGYETLYLGADGRVASTRVKAAKRRESGFWRGDSMSGCALHPHRPRPTGGRLLQGRAGCWGVADFQRTRGVCDSDRQLWHHPEKSRPSVQPLRQLCRRHGQCRREKHRRRGRSAAGRNPF